MPLVEQRPPRTSTYSQLPRKMPTMPHTMVSRKGILSRSPGATSLPRSPITMPPMIRNRMLPRLQLLCPHLASRGAIVETVTTCPSEEVVAYPTTLPPIMALHTPRGKQRASAAEADLAADAAADLDV